MGATAEKLKREIIKKAREKNIDPYADSFKPSDLGIKSDNYGAFADFCDPKEAKSGSWQKDVILKVAQNRKDEKPFKYLLIK
ncbi:hypothetical protein KKH38_00485 [Patescibacteria group bacterium]|nr:hypothetical protein [Patescibacteria group bacterium]MBU4600536.1 hypothetical protein [Patescibacteria group bacterium]MCG2697782.1 hypothetical protein [Candidatus Parcubacteria bacterium]